jgi:hypothetical protein
MEVLDAELVRCRDAYLRLEEKMKFMVEIPLGLRKRVHSGKLKTLDELTLDQDTPSVGGSN